MDFNFQKINNLNIYINPKCSNRSIRAIIDSIPSDIKSKLFLDNKIINIIIFRNPYNRLVSGYLNKYVEHTKYLEEFKNRCLDDISTFKKFVNHLNKYKFEFIDELHFLPQLTFADNNNIDKFDYIFNAENLNKFINFLNLELKKISNFRVKNIIKTTKKTLRHQIKYLGNLIYYDLNREQLLQIIKKKQIPDYKIFYDDKMIIIIDNIYFNDIKFYNVHIV